MAYKRHDKDNNEVSPQPGKTTVNQFAGNEGWSTVTYENFNADYQARNSDNSARTPGTFQARDKDNNARTPAAYQRHDKDNNPVTGYWQHAYLQGMEDIMLSLLYGEVGK